MYRIKKIFFSIIMFAFMVSINCNNIAFAGPRESNDPIDIHVFYSADDGNALATCVSIASLLTNTTEKEKIHIHFVGDEMSQDNQSKIISLKQSIRDFTLDRVTFDMKRLNQFETSYWHPSIMVKLYAAELFPNLDRVLWLDHDVIILKNIRNLYQTDLTSKYIAAVDVAHIYNKYFSQKSLPTSYWITSGMGLYNLDEIRKDNLQEKFLNYSKEYTRTHNKMVNNCGGIAEYALTKSIPKSKAVLLPLRFSLMTFLYTEKRYLIDQHDEISNCFIMHFAGDTKPWNKDNNIMPQFYDIWHKYCIKTPYVESI